jgi:nucleoside-diphosphate-sugar epimerase
VKLLLLGGPRFLGRAIADAALARGHDVTFFNRGKTHAELYPEVERLVGDRDGGLAKLRGRSWDAVIDTSGYIPSAVRRSAEVLTDCGLYCFVSSISVYADFSRTNDEEGTLAELGDQHDDEVTDASYGPLKALCEGAVRDVFGERALVVRPGLIVGPHDPSGRFTYWPHRIARGGEVLAPTPPERLTQAVDVRDLGTWMVVLCEQGMSGTFNATHPGFAWSELMEACTTVSASDAEITWVPEGFLLEHEVGQWMELPLWIADPTMRGAVEADVERALEAGLAFRPLDETVRGALEDAETTDTAGLAPEREVELLEKWHGGE